MPGGGIRATNIAVLIQNGFKEIHSAAIVGNTHLPDPIEIKNMIQLLHEN
jgi:copper homeostasis protein CutC